MNTFYISRINNVALIETNLPIYKLGYGQ